MTAGERLEAGGLGNDNDVFAWLKTITGNAESPDRNRPNDAALARRYLAFARSRALRARYAAAVPTDDNRRHWAHADALRQRRPPIRPQLPSLNVERGAVPLAWMGEQHHDDPTRASPCGRQQNVDEALVVGHLWADEQLVLR